MPLTDLESARAWADIVTGSVTAGLLSLGALVAFWKFVLQQPLRNHWSVQVTPCKVRKIGDRWAYILTIDIENRSTARHHIHGWWRKVRFPDEVPADYDPNLSLGLGSGEEVWSRFKLDSMIDEPYSLSPGERYSDQMILDRGGPLQEVCYVEYALEYQEGPEPLGVRQMPERDRGPQIYGRAWLSQIMVSPIEREDVQ